MCQRCYSRLLQESLLRYWFLIPLVLCGRPGLSLVPAITNAYSSCAKPIYNTLSFASNPTSLQQKHGSTLYAGKWSYQQSQCVFSLLVHLFKAIAVFTSTLYHHHLGHIPLFLPFTQLSINNTRWLSFWT